MVAKIALILKLVTVTETDSTTQYTVENFEINLEKYTLVERESAENVVNWDRVKEQLLAIKNQQELDN